MVDAAAYDAAYTFVFSPRPGTPAADMVDDFVAPEVAQERMRRLGDVVERHALAKHAARVGRTESLLLEGPSKNDATMWSGRTRQNKLVHFSPGEHDAASSAAPPTSSSPTPHRTGCAATWSTSSRAPRPARIRIPVVAAPA